MHRKIFEYSLLAKIVIRMLAVGILFGTGITQMPMIILVTSVVICLGGFVAFFRSYTMQKDVKEITIFLAVEMGIIIFNMMYMAMFSPLTVELYDTLLTGSVFDLVVNTALIVYATKQRKYAVISENASTVKTVRRSAKAYVRPIQNLEIR